MYDSEVRYYVPLLGLFLFFALVFFFGNQFNEQYGQKTRFIQPIANLPLPSQCRFDPKDVTYEQHDRQKITRAYAFCEDSPQEIYVFYEESMPNLGWSTEIEFHGQPELVFMRPMDERERIVLNIVDEKEHGKESMADFRMLKFTYTETLDSGAS